jgi:hypothetical protein
MVSLAIYSITNKTKKMDSLSNLPMEIPWNEYKRIYHGMRNDTSG